MSLAPGRPSSDETWLVQALRDAIEADGIDIAIQPRIVLSDGRLAGFKSLARWVRADGTAVAPRTFVALAERYQLLALLGERVLERTLLQLADWRDRGLHVMPVAVNFLTQQFHPVETVERVARALARFDVPAELLELELTDGLLVGDREAAMRSLKLLADLGVNLTIDRFGTGHSALVYVRRLPIYRTKIDRHLVRDMVDQPLADRDLVKLIIRLAHRMQLRCVATGIETPEHLALLRELGCDEGQGYAVGRPATPEAITELLERESSSELVAP